VIEGGEGVSWKKKLCQDGEDNDGDGLIDYPNDPGCSSPLDNSELEPTPSVPEFPFFIVGLLGLLIGAIVVLRWKG